jgi:phage-related protein
MAAPAILKIDIIADATRAQSAMGKTGGAAQTMSNRLGGVANTIASTFAARKVFEFGKSVVSAAEESRVATSRLENVFKSMGDTTGTAAKAAEDYANTLMKKTGIDDEQIMSAQAVLATFKNVSDETGRQAGVFDRATAAAADLAAAGFGTMDSNAVQLGKALNDPVKGITALARSGVTFTKAQKDQIKTLVEHNQMLDAQKIVLGAIETQVGGTAEATATGSQKMKTQMGELQESIGNGLLPILDAVLPIITTIFTWLANNTPVLITLVVVIGTLVVAWNLASIAATLFGVSMAAAFWPILIVVGAIVALIAIGVLLVKNWDTIKAAAAAVWAFMVGAWNAILNVIRAAFNWIKSNWPLLLAILTGPVGIAVAIIIRYWDSIRNAVATFLGWIRGAWNAITGILTAPVSAAWNVISGIIDRIRGGVSGLIGAVGGFASRIAEGLKAPINAFIRGWNAIELKVPSIDLPFGKSIGGFTLGLPDIPLLARGGTVMRTGLAVVHAGETFSGVGNTSSGGGTTVVNINVTTTGLGADAPQIQRAVVSALRGYVGRNGPLDIPVKAAG